MTAFALTRLAVLAVVFVGLPIVVFDPAFTAAVVAWLEGHGRAAAGALAIPVPTVARTSFADDFGHGFAAPQERSDARITSAGFTLPSRDKSAVCRGIEWSASIKRANGSSLAGII